MQLEGCGQLHVQLLIQLTKPGLLVLLLAPLGSVLLGMPGCLLWSEINIMSLVK
jgi:hypothetical protein